MSAAKQFTPPVTKNQSLADILNEIEERANECRCSECCDKIKLVKALRIAMGICRGLLLENSPTAGIAAERSSNMERLVAAILTSPENGEQQSQSLGEP